MTHVGRTLLSVAFDLVFGFDFASWFYDRTRNDALRNLGAPFLARTLREKWDLASVSTDKRKATVSAAPETA